LRDRERERERSGEIERERERARSREEHRSELENWGRFDRLEAPIVGGFHGSSPVSPEDQSEARSSGEPSMAGPP
jgi:hypothetical protein